MKNILGLDLGTNSIGWAVVSSNNEADAPAGITAAGSRVIPMTADTENEFAKGNAVSQTNVRTTYRTARRRRQRQLLRRERLLRVLALMGFLPDHFARALTRQGRIADPETEPKIAWRRGDDGRMQFVFPEAYDEMLDDIRRRRPDLLADGRRVPRDWTLYYLRTRALTQPVRPEELAWILLSFNQKRGYNQLRGEDAASNKREEYAPLRVERVVDTGKAKGKRHLYDLVLENGMTYTYSSSSCPEWEGRTKDFIITTPLDDDGAPRADKAPTLRLPSPDDWTLRKKMTEARIEHSGQTVGQYIYAALLDDPQQKVRGSLVHTVDRRLYRDELRRILERQCALIPQLADRALYERCVEALYPSNEAHRSALRAHGFARLFEHDILFYQRPLKSKKSLISTCPFEHHTFRDSETGEERRAGVACIARSHPMYQEFRLWQFVGNLRIYERVPEGDIDVTDRLLPTAEKRAALFDKLNEQDTVNQTQVLDFLAHDRKLKKKADPWPIRWNYPEDKTYPAAETRAGMATALRKAGVVASTGAAFVLLDQPLPQRGKGEAPSFQEALWHVLYSVDSKAELRRALETFARRAALADVDAFVRAFADFNPFEKDYGALSAKALKRLLPLMRAGHHWSEEAIDPATRRRIDHLVDGEDDATISLRTREKTAALRRVADFSGLSQWLASYVVYDRHSETGDAQRWTSPDDIDRWLADFRQHSLRNPIVEQVVTETLRTVRDLWRRFGRFDEIHLEMGRDMKQSSKEREKAFKRNADNERARLRTKALLAELARTDLDVKIENVRPYSPAQQDLLRIYVEGAHAAADAPDASGVTDKEIADIETLLAKPDAAHRPTASQLRRYIHWLEQRYRSPYTGQMIPLARLFTTDYEIEHIIPQSRFFDDSFSNKVVCEAEVNRLKSSLMGLEFIRQHGGEKVQLGMGRTVTILSLEDYKQNAERQFKHSPAKLRKLLMDDLPDGFVQRQLNDTRYIARFVKALLSNIVREEGEQEATSKHLIVCTGSVTDRLKREWGAGDVWNSIILPRFQRLNEMNPAAGYVVRSAQGHEIPALPLSQQQGFSKKRIDHRHHAMDAIVIACCTREHVNLLSNEAALSENNESRRRLTRKLRRMEDVTFLRDGKQQTRRVAREFLKPWEAFPADLERVLRSMVVSFKHQQRVINRTSNRTLRYVDGRKRLVPQTKGDAWAVRKPLHKETYYGEINLQCVKQEKLQKAIAHEADIVDRALRKQIRSLRAQGLDEKAILRQLGTDAPEKVDVRYFTRDTKDRYFASREALSEDFTENKIRNEVADTAIQKILLRHLEEMGSPEAAFSPEGIDKMNNDILRLNDGRPHQPIRKVRTYKRSKLKYAVGARGNRKKQFVVAADNTNLFFAVYETEGTDKKTGEHFTKRTFDTIPLRVVVERLKQGLSPAPADEHGCAAKFVLSPFDFVYVPTEQERESGEVKLPLDLTRVYRMVSCTEGECHFLPYSVARPIVDRYEFEAKNKIGRALTGEMIKDVCLPLRVSRLGDVTLDV